jgi:predicted NAD-dependent protein-ADP-ribosyltransferase YbiA (DUF1768 family)
MKAVLKEGLLILVPQTDQEEAELAGWKEGKADHVFGAVLRGSGLALHDLGSKEHACNEPLNVSSRATDPAARLLSNFAATPFELDGRTYASVESFWQGLKFDGVERREVALLDGPAAQRRGQEKGYGAIVRYEGRSIVVGGWEHRELMVRACTAKFEQNEEVRQALLSTGNRTLTHRMRRDSKAIPGAILAEILMKIRRRLQRVEEPAEA